MQLSLNVQVLINKNKMSIKLKKMLVRRKKNEYFRIINNLKLNKVSKKINAIIITV